MLISFAVVNVTGHEIVSWIFYVSHPGQQCARRGETSEILGPGRCSSNLKSVVFKLTWGVDIFSLKLSPRELHATSLIISQYWFMKWLGAIRQRTIPWTNVDQVPLCYMMLFDGSLCKKNHPFTCLALNPRRSWQSKPVNKARSKVNHMFDLSTILQTLLTIFRDQIKWMILCHCHSPPTPTHPLTKKSR